jgi:hypothetical protein
MVALYLERFMNYGLTAGELLSGKPIIGIAQTGGDLTPCNRVHLDTVKRVREGIRDAAACRWNFRCIPFRELPPADGGAGSQSRLSRPGGNPARLSHRRGGADHRLRQDHAGTDHGRVHRGHSRHRVVGWSHARMAGTMATWWARAP